MLGGLDAQRRNPPINKKPYGAIREAHCALHGLKRRILMTRKPKEQNIFTTLGLVLSIFAVIFSGLQWYEAHQQKRLQNRPLVGFYIEDDIDESKKGLAIENHGTGPAVVKALRYFVDDNLIDDSAEILRHGQLDPDQDFGFYFEEGDALGVGQRVWLIDYRAKNPKEMRRFIEFLGDRIKVEIEFCSIDNECWRKCSTKGACSSTMGKQD